MQGYILRAVIHEQRRHCAMLASDMIDAKLRDKHTPDDDKPALIKEQWQHIETAYREGLYVRLALTTERRQSEMPELQS